jgi:hypothetical protein
MRKSLRLFLLLLLAMMPAALFAQEDFSADIVTHHQGEQDKTPAKIYVTKNKLRIESAGRNGQTAAILIDFATQTADMLMPEQHMYMEFPAGKGPAAQRFGTFFRPADIDNACGEWQKMATNPGGECHRVGTDTVNGRTAVKYEAKSTSGDLSTVWLDPKIAFPVKWEGKNSGGELQNIQAGSLSSGLFEVPAGYRKMDMPGGMPNMQPH